MDNIIVSNIMTEIKLKFTQFPHEVAKTWGKVKSTNKRIACHLDNNQGSTGGMILASSYIS